MATEPATDYDLGPLSWVQGEIDQALTRGLEALATFRAAPTEVTALKHARTHVHQAAGAIQMVGLDAVVAYTDEVERHLARLEELPAEAVPAAVDLVDRACRKLKIFLDELVAGAPPVPLKLYPEYEALQHARGVRAVTPTDLFFPDLSPRAPRIAPREPIPSNRLPSYLIKQRRQYQRGLLGWLRGSEEGAKSMRAAIAGIEDATASSSLRSFWWSVGALFEALTANGIEGGFGVKQLAARIDLQIRRVAEGSAKVADRLRREVLYYVAISAPVGPQVQAVQRAFGLAGLIPTAETISTDVVGMQPLIREAREQLTAAKDTWLKFASGRAENLPKLRQTLTSVHTKGAQIKQGALMKLTSALVERLDHLPQGMVPEPLAMEFATALLLAESAFENCLNLPAEFPQQVDAMIGRLDAARAGRAPAAAAPMLDEMSRRAQERVLLAQVGREIQANLRRMEQVLDAFFRDHGKRAELTALTKESVQVRGALRMLGLDTAEELLGLCQAQIEAYADPETPVSDEDLELLAESLSGLGFYVEAVEQQRPERERLIAPLLAKRLGEPAAPAPAESESVEDAVAELRTALPALVEEARRTPTDASVRETLTGKLANLRDDAELIGDTALAAQASEALKEFEAGGAAALAATVDAIAETAAPAPEISEETQRLLDVDATSLDAELLDIYLTEAGEVLDTIAASLATLEQNHGDREALRTIRRGYHTLKGSGRMVGLTELGELAWAVEQIHNRLLDEERPVTNAVVALERVAAADFRTWIDDLRATGHARPDPAALMAAVGHVEAELPGGKPKPAAAPPTPPVLVPAPTTAPADAAVARAAEGVAPRGEPPVLELVELPELGEGDGAAPSVEVDLAEGEGIEVAELPPIEAAPVGAPALKLVADNTRPPAAHAPPPERAVATPLEVVGDIVDPPPQPLGIAPSPESDEVAIGDVTLSTSLWRILTEEAEQHLATLEHELSLLQFDPLYPPSDAMIRASHTLCGIHRTGGLHIVAALAKALELALIALSQRDAPLPAAAQPVLARAVYVLRGLVTRVQERQGFHPHDELEAREVQSELEALRLDAGIEAVIEVDAETAAAHAAAREDEQVDAEPADVPPAAAPVPVHAEPAELPMPVSVLPEVAIPQAEAPGVAMPAGEVAQGEWPAADEAPAGATPVTAEAVAVPVEFAGAAVVPAAAALPPVSTPGETIELAGPAAADAIQSSEAVPAVVEAPPAVAEAAPVAEAPGAAIPLAAVPPVLAEAVAEAAVMLPPPVEDPLATIRDEVDEQVVAIFLEEAAELFPAAGEQLRAWRRSPADPASALQLRRTLHTFKGSARMAGAMRLGELTHLMESRLMDGDSLAQASPELFEALDTDLDRIAFVLDRLREGESNVPLPWVAAAEAEAAPPAEAQPEPVAERPVVVPLAPAMPAPAEPMHATAAAMARAEAVEAEAAKAMLRVRADVIDRLVNEAGEVAIARARVESELRALKSNLLELTGSVIRLRTQVREIEIQAESQIQSHLTQLQEHASEFDPLEFDRFTRFQELTRSLAEGVNDVSTVQQQVLRNLDDADAALLAQARLSRDVQQQLFAIRTVPFGSLSERLYRIMRQGAKELDKRANLEIVGAQTELDRSVLEKLAGPLEHLLRNALDHGVERREARRLAGKSETGEVTLTVRQSGNEIVIELADDGAGIDLARVLEKARAHGVVAADAQPTEAQLLDCIFRAGFSTATRVTAISGRGVGMDVVRSDVAALGGRVEVATVAGRGTTFTLALPLTLAVAQAVLVRAGGRLWALPAGMVEQVQQVRAEALLELYVRRSVDWMGKSYPLHYLPRLLGDTAHTPETQRYNAVLLLKSGHAVAAVHVDEMVGNQEIVVKNIGPQLARVSGVSGATVLGTGEIVLIINPVQLAQRADIPVFDPNAEAQAAVHAPAPAAGPPLVLVVDDSLTVRKITSRMLAREGFAVQTAKDGIDALQVIAEQIPDMILLDIEMPRMDGFEFTKTVKNDPKLAHIPIIMITSRTADKHRARAAELGVDLYLGKPFQEDELLRNLREMLGVAATA